MIREKGSSDTHPFLLTFHFILVLAHVSRAAPSNVPRPMTSYRGHIQVIKDADNSFIGYVSKNSVANSYLREEPGVGSALIVDFSVPISATTTIQIEISTEVSNDNIFPDVARKSLMPFSESRYWIQFAQPYPRTGRCRQYYSTGKLPVGPCSYPPHTNL